MDALFGTSSEIEPAKAVELFKDILAQEEEIRKAYQVVRDTFVLTNKRLILMDKQGITGKKSSINPFPTNRLLSITSPARVWCCITSAFPP